MQDIATSPSGAVSKSAILVEVGFKWTHGGTNVYLAGTFNKWKERIPMKKQGDVWFATRKLPPGRHEYKFIVDNVWRFAPNQLTIRDSIGNINNYTDVAGAQHSFTGSAQPPTGATTPEIQGYHGSATRGDATPPVLPHASLTTRPQHLDEYFSRELPANPAQRWSDAPPPLQRHLTHTPLNATIGPDAQPLLLPIPDHVVLTHLFQQRRRKMVRVSSVTVRHRSKFATTVMYLSGRHCPPCDGLLELAQEGLMERIAEDLIPQQ
eukprot:gnl/Dysnectes_brevis/2624_a3170_1509.p1 GENE.gnl/Dysnectes_brevis/2624_a3170_1509~~gnl/Dysnectes_brevis/2624_a3170_1509.p1  ORF type:complete len:265 (-),score=57.69 gnl/Dysnectes_brevis/2624_a3170_1509:87-881(-)